MSMAVGDQKGSVIADINVTPMADIMIVLLIIFMVITPLLQKGVDVKLPVAGNTKERKDEKTITVAIRGDSSAPSIPLTGGASDQGGWRTCPKAKIVFLKADELPYSR